MKTDSRTTTIQRAASRIIPVIILILSVGLAVPELRAQEVDYAGTSVANFLKIPVGARGMAMVGSDVTSAHDATALSWNPGTITLLPANSITFSHTPWLVDTKVNYAAAVYQFGFASVGLDLHFFDSGDIEETTLGEQSGTGRYISTTSYALGFAVSRAFTDRFSVGLKVKYLQESLANADASGYGMDLGAVFLTGLLRDLKLAFALTNFGSKLQFGGRDLRVISPVPGNPEGKSVPAQLQTGEWDLPLAFRLGVSSDIIDANQYRMTVNYSVLDTRDYRPRHLIGGEILLMNLLALRGGYDIRPDENIYALGAGLQVGYQDVATLQVDYSYMQQPYFSNAQQFTLSVLF